jgi:hypothetical protein
LKIEELPCGAVFLLKLFIISGRIDGITDKENNH